MADPRINDKLEVEDQYIQMTDYGGVNTVLDDTRIRDDQGVLKKNVLPRLNERRTLATRKGYTTAGAAFITTEKIYGVHRYYKKNPSTNYYLVATDDKYISRTGITDTTMITGLTQNQYTSAAQILDRLWIANGTDKLYKFDGTNLYEVGVTANSNPPINLTDAGAGQLNGTYKWKVNFVNGRGTEGNAGQESTTINVTNRQVTIDITAAVTQAQGLNGTNGENITQIGIYRTDGAGIPPFRRVAFIVLPAGPGPHTYTDNTSDQALGVEDPIDNAKPGTGYKLLEWWNKRMFATKSNNSSLWVTGVVNDDVSTDISNPEIFSALGEIPIDPDSDGEELTGLKVLGGYLYVLKSTGIWRITGDIVTPTLFPIKVSDEGCNAPYSIATGNGAMFWLHSKKGIFMFNGSSIKNIGDEIIDFIEDEMDNTFIESAYGAYDSKRKEYWLSYYDKNNNQKIAVYSVQDGWFLPQEGYDANTLIYLTGRNDNGIMVGGSSNTDGFLKQLNTGTNDNGTAISIEDISKRYNTGNNLLDKRFRHYFIEGVVNTSGNFTIEYDIDKGKFGGVFNFNITSTTLAWDRTWDRTWGKSTIKPKKFNFPQGAVGRSIQRKIKCNILNMDLRVLNEYIAWRNLGIRIKE